MLWIIESCQNKVSTDQYHVTISCAQGKSSLRLHFFKLTADQLLVFHWIAGSSLVITVGKKEGVRAKAKFWRKLTPGALWTFLPTYSFLQSSLRKSLMYCICNLYNLSYTFNWKE